MLSERCRRVSLQSDCKSHLTEALLSFAVTIIQQPVLVVSHGLVDCETLSLTAMSLKAQGSKRN